jgi:hypothetical protein
MSINVGNYMSDPSLCCASSLDKRSMHFVGTNKLACDFSIEDETLPPSISILMPEDLRCFDVSIGTEVSLDGSRPN